MIDLVFRMRESMRAIHFWRRWTLSGRVEFAVRRVSIGVSRSLLIAGLMLVLVVGPIEAPAQAAITGVSPGSATVVAGVSSIVSTTATSDVGGVGASASSPLQVIGVQGDCTVCKVTVQVFSTADPGTYNVAIFDAGGGRASFSVNVVEPATTTTTEPPTTTTTEPPTTTTTTSTLVPAAISALGDGDDGSTVPLVWLGGGAALLAAALLATYAFVSRRRPAYGAATPGFLLTWRRRNEQRRVTKRSRARRTTSLGNWWRTSGPLVSFQEWKGSRQAARTMQRRIEERRRLHRKDG